MVRKLPKAQKASSEAIDQALKEVTKETPEVVVPVVSQISQKRSVVSPAKKEEPSPMVPHNQRVSQELFDRIDAAFREERIKRRSGGQKFTKNSLGIEAFELWLKHNGY